MIKDPVREEKERPSLGEGIGNFLTDPREKKLSAPRERSNMGSPYNSEKEWFSMMERP